MLVKEEKFGSYELHTIKTDRFKTCHIEIIFRNNVNVNELTIRNVLFEVLTEVTKKYCTNRLLNIKLESLYNASMYSVTSRVGKLITTSLCIDFLSPKYSEENIIEEAIKLLSDIIFDPVITNNEFNKDVLEFVKHKLSSEMKSIIENPRKKSIINGLKTLNTNPTSYDTQGNLEDLEKITTSSLYEYYQKVLNNDYVDIYVIGNLDMDKVSQLFRKYNKLKVIKNHSIDTYVEEQNRKLITKYDTSTYNQTNIVCFINLNKLTNYEKNYIANIYNIILGGGSLQTKLSKKLRTENSLCYNVQSSYLKYDNLIMIYTSVDPNAEDKAIKLIKDAIKDMKNNISDEELSEAKELVLTSLKMIEDSPGRIIDNQFYINQGLLDPLQDRIQNFKNITQEEIYALSNKIKLTNIYSLRGVSNEES